MTLMIKRILLLSVSILSFLSITSKAAENIDDLVWTSGNSAPYNYLNENNEVEGKSVDIMRNIFKSINSKACVSDIKVLPWTIAYEEALKNKNYALMSAARIPEREKLFKWAGPLISDKVIIFSKKSNNIKIENLNDLKKYRVAAVDHEVAQQLVTSAVKDLKLYMAMSTNDNLQKLNEGTVDLMVTDSSMINYLVKKNGLDTKDYESIYTLKEIQLWIAFNILTSDELVQTIQDAFDKQ
jgi:polar amino acid transport system substrate-binding protein